MGFCREFKRSDFDLYININVSQNHIVEWKEQTPAFYMYIYIYIFDIF